jgi:hypothetical protein
MKRRVRELYTVIVTDHIYDVRKPVKERRNLSWTAAQCLVSRYACDAFRRYGGKITYGLMGAESGDYPRRYRVAVLHYQVR